MDSPSPKQLSYAFTELLYRNGQNEQWPSDLKLKADGVNLWAFDALGPLYCRPLARIAAITRLEVPACQ